MPKPAAQRSLTHGVVRVVDEGLGDVESESDVGADGDDFVTPFDLGQSLCRRVTADVLPPHPQLVLASNLPLEGKGRNGLVSPQIEVVLEVEGRAISFDQVRVEPDFGL